jgi:hypothetical protein
MMVWMSMEMLGSVDVIWWDFGWEMGKNFMDMSISIKDNKFEIDLYEKPLNLYLYISPSLAHPPGMITGLVFGMTLRLWKLCSRASDVKRRIKIFYR